MVDHGSSIAVMRDLPRWVGDYFMFVAKDPG